MTCRREFGWIKHFRIFSNALKRTTTPIIMEINIMRLERRNASNRRKKSPSLTIVDASRMPTSTKVSRCASILGALLYSWCSFKYAIAEEQRSMQAKYYLKIDIRYSILMSKLKTNQSKIRSKYLFKTKFTNNNNKNKIKQQH